MTNGRPTVDELKRKAEAAHQRAEKARASLTRACDAYDLARGKVDQYERILPTAPSIAERKKLQEVRGACTRAAGRMRAAQERRALLLNNSIVAQDAYARALRQSSLDG